MNKNIIWAAIAILAFLIGIQLSSRSDDAPREIIKEVPKEVEKVVERRVEVPAEIPEAYQNALAFFERVKNAKRVSSTDGLAGIKAVSVYVVLDDVVKKFVDESDIRTKFEITLRRSGIPIDESSQYSLWFSVEGFTRDGGGLLVYTVTTTLDELVLAFRDEGVVLSRTVSTWRQGSYGTVGTAKVRETMIGNAETAAESFANIWLSKNPAEKK